MKRRKFLTTEELIRSVPPPLAQRQEIAMRIISTTSTPTGVIVGLKMHARATCSAITEALDQAVEDLDAILAVRFDCPILP